MLLEVGKIELEFKVGMGGGRWGLLVFRKNLFILGSDVRGKKVEDGCFMV